MPITNVQAVKFCNEQIRPAAEAILKAYYRAKEVRNKWYADNMGAILPVGGGTVVDGSESDGRTPIVSDDAILVINRLEDLINDLEAGGNAKLNTLVKPSVNW